MNFSLSSKVNPPIVFIARLGELTDRFDPEMVLFRRKKHQFRYPVQKFRESFLEAPQYGANERGLERESIAQPRYIRITDIDEHGSLIDELGATAATVELRYLLKEDDLLLARSGNTVGKAYLHKGANVQYLCFFAGYLIRFRLKPDKLLPDYAFAITQLSYYKDWVHAVQRAAGQPNINATEYSNFDIPVPPLAVQIEIVSLLKQANDTKNDRLTEAHGLLRKIDEVLLEELGIQRKSGPPSHIENRIFRSSLGSLTGGRWDPNYLTNMKRFLAKLGPCHFPIHKLKDFVDLVQYGISERATEEVVGVPMLRMLNLQDGFWDISDMKYIDMSEDERRPYLLNQGDILFNRTNSKELVGKCNVFDLSGEYVFASYLMRVRLKKDGRLRPEFAVAYMASSLGRIQIDAVSRQIAGMTNINAEEVRELIIPIPPPLVQDRICHRVAEIRQVAAKLRSQGITEFEAAKKPIEAILMDGSEHY